MQLRDLQPCGPYGRTGAPASAAPEERRGAGTTCEIRFVVWSWLSTGWERTWGTACAINSSLNFYPVNFCRPESLVNKGTRYLLASAIVPLEDKAMY